MLYLKGQNFIEISDLKLIDYEKDINTNEFL
jgi:hypothetical protein